MTNYVAVRAQLLSSAVAQFFHRLGSNETEARLIADNLVLANLSGHDSHGVGLVPLYLEGVNARGHPGQPKTRNRR